MPSTTDRARDLRALSPPAERRIWQHLRDRRLAGVKFVRQLPIGPYFVDFASREHRLAIEIDGATHSTDAERARDALRTQLLQRAGYTVLRFTNDEVYRTFDGVMETILAQIENRETL